MEPRPPKANRPAGSTPVGPSSGSEPQPERPQWMDHSSLSSLRPPPNRADRASDTDIDSANARARMAWQDPTLLTTSGVYNDGVPRTPLTPVVAPRGERGSRYLGPILAAVLLAVIIAGIALAIRYVRDGDDRRDADATRSAGLVAASPSPEQTTIAGASPTSESGEGVTSAATPADSEPASSPTAAGEETEPEPTATREPRRTPTSTSQSGGSSVVRARELLPSADDLPDGFVLETEGAYGKADMVDQLGGDEEEVEALLREWTWRENAFRTFSIPADARPDPDTTFALTVSIHRFGTRDGAEAGLNYLADFLAGAGLGYEEVDVDPIGDQARALTATQDGVNIYALYVRSGRYVYRLGGSNAEGNPAPDVIALAELLLEMQESNQ